MGRFWLGVCLLCLGFGLGLWSMYAMGAVNEPVSRLLEEAAQAALSGDLEQGIMLADRAQTAWEDCWHLTASAADHAPMDEIDSIFAQVSTYAQAGSPTDFAAFCARLAQLVDAVGEAHSLTWWNLL